MAGDPPVCCDEPMVHNSFTEEHECAVAYFELSDAGYGDCPALLWSADVPAALAPTLEHWRSSRIPDADLESPSVPSTKEPTE